MLRFPEVCAPNIIPGYNVVQFKANSLSTPEISCLIPANYFGHIFAFHSIAKTQFKYFKSATTNLTITPSRRFCFGPDVLCSTLSIRAWPRSGCRRTVVDGRTFSQKVWTKKLREWSTRVRSITLLVKTPFKARNFNILSFKVITLLKRVCIYFALIFQSKCSNTAIVFLLRKNP